MTHFTGTGLRPGVAIAAAARLRTNFGVASLAPERLGRIAARLRAFGVESPEPEQVILVADSVPFGFAASSAGLEVIGIAAGSASELNPRPDCPTVVGLGEEFFETVAEDDIIIVDGSRGRVYVSPDASVIARYQAPSTRTRRIFLEGTHLPARTASDGRLISVFASAWTAQDVTHALAAGADGLFLESDSDLLGGKDGPLTAGEQVHVLEAMIETIGGLPLLLCIPPERLALTALARGSAAGPISLLLGDTETRDDVQARLAEIEQAYEEDEVRFGTPQFELAVSADTDDSPLPETLDGFAGVAVTESFSTARMERLLMIAAQAHRARKPMLLTLSHDWPSELPTALSLGATRLVVPADDLPNVKDAIRAW